MAQLNLSDVNNITTTAVNQALNNQHLSKADVDSIYIPWSECTIGNNAFQYFTNLTTIVGGVWNIKSIGDYAFQQTALTSFNAGLDAITTVGKYAFLDCSNLTDISLPACTVSEGTFKNCINLNLLWLSINGEIPAYLLYNCEKLETTSLFYPGNNITAVNDYAFTNCKLLNSIIIENCKKIGKHAFEGCTAVVGINCINCTEIDESAFKNCEQLETIWTGNIHELKQSVFQNCKKLQNTNLYWNDELTSINAQAFENCEHVTTCNPNIIKLGDYAFASCYNFNQELQLPACTEIGRYAFLSCQNLSSLNAPQCTFVDYNAFYGTKLWDVDPQQ